MTTVKTKFKETEIGPIPEEWSFEPLKNHAEIIMGQSPESIFYNNGGDGLVFLQGIRTFGEKYPTYDTYTTKITKKAKTGSVLLSVRAPVGEVNIATKDICIGRGLMAINSQNNEFIYQLFKAFKEYVVGKETGTVYGSVTRDDISSLKFPFPPINEQKQIAEILSSLDDKIELNHRINANLEAVASALFKKWFTDIGELPEGWSKQPISSFGKIVCGKTPPKNIDEYFNGNIPFIKIPDMHKNIFIHKTGDSLTRLGADSQKNKTIPANSICTSCIATVGLVSMTTNDSQTNQQINSIVPLKSYYQLYLFHALKSLSKYLQDIGSSGSATLNINTKVFSLIHILKPDDKTLMEFDLFVRPIFEEINKNIKESLNLSMIRDILLPKLLNGKITT